MDKYEYKDVKVPAGNSRKTTRIIERMVNQGWEYVETRRGGLLFGSKDTAVFRRRVS